MKIKRDINQRKDEKLTAADLVSCYKAVFGDSNGQIVYHDLIDFINGLIGDDGNIDFRLPHHELAACAALMNLREYIIALTREGEINE